MKLKVASRKLQSPVMMRETYKAKRKEPKKYTTGSKADVILRFPDVWQVYKHMGTIRITGQKDCIVHKARATQQTNL